jgi:hypothetical protein
MLIKGVEFDRFRFLTASIFIQTVVGNMPTYICPLLQWYG